MLPREEYIEQAYFFRMLSDRLKLNMPIQELMDNMREELLSSTKLPLAIGFLVDQLRFSGQVSPAMSQLPHYFSPFQTFVVGSAEDERAKSDFGIAMAVLEQEAKYRAEGATPQGLFLFQFEAISRNRLGYDAGLTAMAGDPLYSEGWREWLLFVRREVGLIDLADMIYLRSQHYVDIRARQQLPPEDPDLDILFGEKEGKIAMANRGKDPLFLFAALQRHLGYPTVPRPKPAEEDVANVPKLIRKLERLETRLRFLEEEAKGGIDLTKIYERPAEFPTDDE